MKILGWKKTIYYDGQIFKENLKFNTGKRNIVAHPYLNPLKL